MAQYECPNGCFGDTPFRCDHGGSGASRRRSLGGAALFVDDPEAEARQLCAERTKEVDRAWYRARERAQRQEAVWEFLRELRALQPRLSPGCPVPPRGLGAMLPPELTTAVPR